MNRRKKTSLLLLIIGLTSTLISCALPLQSKVEPQISQMKSIAELATLDCYFHNVAKYKIKDAEVFLIWKKDKHFWVEYSGIVKIGIDPSQLVIEVKGDNVTIQIPEAKVLGHQVNQGTLSKDSFIVDKDSADITAEDETLAFKEAQEKMLLTASEDFALMESAQQRAKILLEEYIENIGKQVGKVYSINWN